LDKKDTKLIEHEVKQAEMNQAHQASEIQIEKLLQKSSFLESELETAKTLAKEQLAHHQTELAGLEGQIKACEKRGLEAELAEAATCKKMKQVTAAGLKLHTITNFSFAYCDGWQALCTGGIPCPFWSALLHCKCLFETCASACLMFGLGPSTNKHVIWACCFKGGISLLQRFHCRLCEYKDRTNASQRDMNLAINLGSIVICQ
jgi:hypothetical protein